MGIRPPNLKHLRASSVPEVPSKASREHRWHIGKSQSRGGQRHSRHSRGLVTDVRRTWPSCWIECWQLSLQQSICQSWLIQYAMKYTEKGVKISGQKSQFNPEFLRQHPRALLACKSTLDCAFKHLPSMKVICVKAFTRFSLLKVFHTVWNSSITPTILNKRSVCQEETFQMADVKHNILINSSGLFRVGLCN